VGAGKERKIPRQQSTTPNKRRRRTSPCILGCFARRRACSPSLVSWWLEGSEPWSRRRAGGCPAPSRDTLLASITTAAYSPSGTGVTYKRIIFIFLLLK
jgi:hypothetical protein